jgi:Ni,Fe-hydrogenase maturation factor
VKSKKEYKILVFGNPLVKKDSLPLKMIEELKKKFPNIEFKEFDPTEDLEKEGRELNIIDTVEGIKKTVLITNIDLIKVMKVFSMHDFDLGYNLKLLKKLKKIDKVNIFGVPMKIKKKEALEQLIVLIKSNLF